MSAARSPVRLSPVRSSLLLVLSAWAVHAAPPLFADTAAFRTAQARLMTPAGFGPADFNLLINYRVEIPKTLSAVETLLRRPQSVDSLVPALRASLGEASPGGFLPASGLWQWLDRPFHPPRFFAKPSPSARLEGVNAALAAYVKPFSAEEIAFLRREMPSLLVHNGEDTSLNAIESETERLRGDAITDSVMRLVGKLSQAELAGAADGLEAVLADLLESARRDGIPATRTLLEGLRKKGIPVEIGSPGRDVHRLDRGIVFDPGGDDRYEFPDTARPGGWLLVIDLAGNDEYHAADSVGGAAAFLSAQILYDGAGDDRYLGRDLAFGAAVMGYAHLFDGGGDDVYEARSASLGFAFHGIGVLQDVAGNDLYSAYFFSEGAASTNGLGLLRDETGNDQYLSRPAFPDDLRYQDHFLSMNQGFSSGFAPRHAGGIAVLWDRAGEDLYVADIFGQGTGYWFAWGLLMDDAGNDKFIAHQYAQGAGVHFAAGTLWDRAGDDLRASKGVSQGCGHDGGFGMMVDAAGNDRNSATDMSAGAGSANGLGVFLDFAGDDFYTMGNPAMTLGHGDMRRDRGSLGFFLDLGGRDAYPAAGPKGPRENAAWRVYEGRRRGYGYGLDAE